MNCQICKKESENIICNDCFSFENAIELFRYLYFVASKSELENTKYDSSLWNEENLEKNRENFQKLILRLPEKEKDFLQYKCKKELNSKIKDDAILCDIKENSSYFLNKHGVKDGMGLAVLYDYVSLDYREDYITPLKRFEYIKDTDGLSYEFYYKAGEYYARTGEYDLADMLLEKAKNLYTDESTVLLIKYPTKFNKIESLIDSTYKYRTKKPYWPVEEKHREILRKVYESKGISTDSLWGSKDVVKKSGKIKAEEFVNPEYIDDIENVESFCSIWFNFLAGVKANTSYEITVIKVVDGKIVGSYNTYILPWDGERMLNKISKKVGVSTTEFQNSAKGMVKIAEEVNAFSENLPLLVSGSEQRDLLIRAYRYGKQKSLPGKVMDLSELAEFIIEEDYTRKVLLEKVDSTDLDAVSASENNIKIFNYLKGLV